MPVGQDGVARVALIGPQGAAAAGDGHGMVILRTALGDEQVVPAVLLVDVRRFGAPGVDQRAPPGDPLLPHDAVLLQIHLRHPHARIMLRPVGGGGHVAGSVLVPEEGRVDALRAADHMQITPGPRRILGRDVEVAHAADVGGDHVEQPVMPADGGGIHAAGHGLPVQRELLRAAQAMAQLLPVNEVAAVKERNAGEVAEGRGDHIKVVPHAANGRIGVEPRQKRVMQHRYPSRWAMCYLHYTTFPTRRKGNHRRPPAIASASIVSSSPLLG